MKKLVLSLIGMLAIFVLINAYSGTRNNQNSDGTEKDPIVLLQEDNE